MKKQHSARSKSHPMKKVMLVTLASTLCATSAVYANTPLISEITRIQAEEIAILDQQGWLESASVEWQAMQDAVGYRAYYKNASASEDAYQRLDDSLIRRYPDHFRADVLGLPEGEYVIKVVPVLESGEALDHAAITDTISVTAHTREGFAFAKESPMGTGSGGYNDDGSVPKEAQIIYITADNVNKVQLDVITSSSGKVTSCTGLVNILAARQKGYDKRPLIIRMIGTVKDTDISGLNSSGYIQLKGIYNTTFEGIGEDATAYGWGFLIRDAHNVELRNVGVMLFKDDAISLDTGNENIWVHNNDIFYGSAGSDSDQAKGDGSCDVKGFSNYVTVSYNHFWDSGKSSLCGMSDSKEFFVTYHHNWYDHSDSRHPRIRVGTIHIYNNYFDGNSKYGVGITKGGSAFVEANDFRNCKYPMLISRQGSDVATDSKGTFSGEPGGMIKAYNNQITGVTRLVYHTEDEIEFDAYLAATREEEVPAEYKTVEGGNTYNNFDTSSMMYDYTPDAPENVRGIVTSYAGRMSGGDFEWTFTEADDTDYGVNTGLMSAIRSYQSELVSIGGGAETIEPPVEPEIPDTGNPNPGEPDSGNGGNGSGSEVTSGSQVHNFTTQGNESDYFTITGNLSDSKGSVTYEDMTLTQCLKLESSTSITFTLSKPGKLTLVLDAGFSKKVKIDGTNINAVNGLLSVALEAGEHTIAKGDTANLFYMVLEVEDDEESSEEDQEALDKQAAEKVEALIEALPTPEEVAKEGEAAIKAARAAYEALTESQKELVGADSLAKLEAVEEAFATLDKEEEDKEDQETLDKQAAEKVETLIEALPAPEEVSEADEVDIKAARAAYESLTEAQKELIGADSLTKLEAVEEAFAELDKEDKEEDKEEDREETPEQDDDDDDDDSPSSSGGSGTSIKVVDAKEAVTKLSTQDLKSIKSNFNQQLPYTQLNTGLSVDDINKLTNGKLTANQCKEIMENPELLIELGLIGALPAQITLEHANEIDFKDLSKKHWAYEAVEKAAQMGLVAGLTDRTFAPGTALQISDTFTFLDRVLLRHDITQMKLSRDQVESYVTDKQHWAFAHVASIGSKLSEQTLEAVSQLGDAPMTRELLAQVLYEVTEGKLDATYAAENFEDVKDSAYEEAIAYCVQAGLLKGTGYQRMQPQKAVTRAELMQILIRLDASLN